MSRYVGGVLGDRAVHNYLSTLFSFMKYMQLLHHHRHGNRYILVGVWRWEGELVCVTVYKFTPFCAITMPTTYTNIVQCYIIYYS